MLQETRVTVHANGNGFIVDRNTLAYWLKRGAQIAKSLGLRPGQVIDIPMVKGEPMSTSMERLSTSIVIFSEGKPVNK